MLPSAKKDPQEPWRVSIRRPLLGATVALVAALTVPAQAGPSQQAASSSPAANSLSSSSAAQGRKHGGLTLDPRTTEQILRGTAKQTPCPVPALLDYPDPNSVDALCVGTIEHNGFYGDGVVNALTASIG